MSCRHYLIVPVASKEGTRYICDVDDCQQEFIPKPEPHTEIIGEPAKVAHELSEKIKACPPAQKPEPERTFSDWHKSHACTEHESWLLQNMLGTCLSWEHPLRKEVQEAWEKTMLPKKCPHGVRYDIGVCTKDKCDPLYQEPKNCHGCEEGCKECRPEKYEPKEKPCCKLCGNEYVRDDDRHLYLPCSCHKAKERPEDEATLDRIIEGAKPYTKKEIDERFKALLDFILLNNGNTEKLFVSREDWQAALDDLHKRFLS